MSGWIDVEDSLPTHRKTLEAADDLDIEPVQLVGHLTCFWLWAINNADNGGRLPEGIRARTIARAALWKGEPEQFVQALMGRFLDRCEDRLCIHDWDEHYGKFAEQRERDAERKRRWRDQNGTDRGPDADASRTSNGRDRPSRAGVNRTKPDQSKDTECHLDSGAREADETSSRLAPKNKRLPDAAEAVIERDGRRFLAGVGWVDAPAEPVPLHPGLQTCPLCNQPFDGEYGVHLEAAPQHKVSAAPKRGNLGHSLRGARHDPIPPEVTAELERAARERPTEAQIAAEAERLSSTARVNGHAVPGPAP